MLLGAELMARDDLDLNLGNFFETWLSVAGVAVRRSLGRDEYHLAVRIPAGSRVAATGRTHICQVDTVQAGLGPLKAPPARPATLPVADLLVCLHLRTNTCLDQAQLRQTLILRLIGDAVSLPREFTLPSRQVRVETLAPGRFLVQLTRVLQELA